MVICQILKSHGTKKLSILTRIERFRTVTLVWIHRWLWNDAQSLKQHRRGALLFSRSSIKFQGHTGQKNANFYSNWAFPNSNSSLNSPRGLRRCTKLDVMYKSCPVIFEVIHQISRSRRLKNRRFESNLSKISRPVAAIKSLRFALFQYKLNYFLMKMA